MRNSWSMSRYTTPVSCEALFETPCIIIAWHIKSCSVAINYIGIKTFKIVSIKRCINFVFQFHLLRRPNIEMDVEYSDEFRRLQKEEAVTLTIMYYSAVIWMDLGRYKKIQLLR